MAAGCSQRLPIIRGDRMHPSVVKVGNMCLSYYVVRDLVQCSRLNRFAVVFVVALGLLAVVEVGYDC